MDNIHVTPPTGEEITEIVCILDRSGSMDHLTSKTIEGYNAFLKDQKALPGKANWTLCLFDGGRGAWNPESKSYELVHISADINTIPELNTTTYVANGSTALLDAMGHTIKEIHEKVKNNPNAKVIVMVITDGDENASTEYKKEQIATMVKEREDNDKWAFIFLGANIDSFSAGAGYGMKGGNTMNFSASDHGMERGFSNISKSTMMYRSFSKADLMDNVVSADDLIANNGEEKESDINP
jgi:hypothetical protein